MKSHESRGPHRAPGPDSSSAGSALLPRGKVRARRRRPRQRRRRRRHAGRRARPGHRLQPGDGKLVELAAWAPVAERVAGPSGEEAIELLRAVRTEMEDRYRELLARGLRKVRRGDGLPLHLVVCDELAFYLTVPEKAVKQEFAELLRDLVARGRAAGVIVCAATQKPGADVVPSALRDLFGF